MLKLSIGVKKVGSTSGAGIDVVRNSLKGSQWEDQNSV